MSNLHGVYFTGILTEMCDRVGVDYKDIDFSKDAWYEDHTWTKNDQNKFIVWFAKHLKHMGPRRELCSQPALVRTLPERMKFAEQFVYEFSWKLSN